MSSDLISIIIIVRNYYYSIEILFIHHYTYLPHSHSLVRLLAPSRLLCLYSLAALLDNLPLSRLAGHRIFSLIHQPAPLDVSQTFLKIHFCQQGPLEYRRPVNLN